jgi:hypothetical protein
MRAHRNGISVVAQLRCDGASVMGRWRLQVHELHHTEVVLLGLHMGEKGTVSDLSMVAVSVEIEQRHAAAFQ